MLKGQKGQAFIFVLILLSVGALVITPMLALSWTGLQGRMAQNTRLMEYYAADGAQEYTLWLLSDPEFTATLSSEEPNGPYYIILNGIKAEYTITVQASEGAPAEGPVEQKHKFKITKTVSPDSAPIGVETTFTYTIVLKYMNPDVTEPLEEILDDPELPKNNFSYVAGSTIGSITTADPQILGGGDRLKWVLDPPVTFEYYEEKILSFQVTATLDESTYSNQVTLEPNHTLSSVTAPIVVGNPDCTSPPDLSIRKEVQPKTVYTGVNTTLTYDIYITNLGCEPMDIHYIRDALPLGFSYVAESSTDILDNPPATEEPGGTLIVDGTRIELEWNLKATDFLNIAAGETLTGSFQAQGMLVDSGTYANEVWVITSPQGEFYSWQQAGVVVPQYDIESSAGGTTIRSVAEVFNGKHKIKSWQVE